MLKQFQKDMKLSYSSLVLVLMLAVFSFAGGIALVSLICSGTDAEDWFCMGTMITLIMTVIFGALSGLSYHSEFMLALSMGRTRKEFMVSYALRQILTFAVAYLMIHVIYRVEMLIYPLMFPHLASGVEFPFVTSWWLPLFIPLMTMLSMFIGALYSRFGKKWMGVLWVIWMACCFVLPRLIPDDPETSPVFMFLFNLPGGIWMAAAVIAFLGMTVTVLHLGRKQYVH